MANVEGVEAQGGARVDERTQAAYTLLKIGVVLGVGIAGTLDEVVLHQLLQWHNFYVHTTEFWRVVSDGVFHLFSAALLVAGAWLLWEQRHVLSRYGQGRALVAGIFLGAGGFNTFDGIVNHKVLRLHPVREGVDNIWPYDVVFVGIALVLVGIGWVLWRGVDGRRR